MTPNKPNPATRALYHPGGRAREFAAVACNPYKGCAHGCKYCFVPLMPPFPQRADFHAQVTAREFIKLEREIAFKRDKEEWTCSPVLFSFTTDPYQPIEKDLQHTRSILIALKDAGFAVNILTKNPELALRDLDILDHARDKIGTTLTTTSIAEAARWEPYAGSPISRICALLRFKNKGFFVWVSLEPIILAASTLRVIDMTAGFVDHYKAGLLNYANRIPDEELRSIGMQMDRATVACVVVEALEDKGFAPTTIDYEGWLTYYPKETIRDALGAGA